MTIPQTELVTSKTAKLCLFDDDFQALPTNVTTTVCIIIKGVVQGFSVKPIVLKLAKNLKVSGEVYNSDQDVVVECKAKVEVIIEFINELIEQTLTLAHIRAVQCKVINKSINNHTFSISASTSERHPTLITVAADKAACKCCTNDSLQDEARQNHAFTCCANCGPRLSISKISPNGCSNISMQPFHMCQSCEHESECSREEAYQERPNTCEICGPKLLFVDEENRVLAKKEPIKHAVKAINAGKLVAVKGIGGFQIAVNAFHAEAVEDLRKRKNRPHKPFGVMVKDIATAKTLAFINEYEQALLESPEAPIVLLKKRALCDSLTGLAPDQSHIGIMLPSTSMHHLLLTEANIPLIITSANKPGEPQIIDNQRALFELNKLADFFLLHDIQITHRLDDSIAQVVGGKTNVLRRARGYVPESLPVPEGFEDAVPVLAMGADTKNTACFLSGRNAVITQHFGELTNIKNVEEQANSVNAYLQFLNFTPKVIAVDANPEYKSSQLGCERLQQFQGISTLEAVQHHHAHIASCMGENLYSRNNGNVIGIALDERGYANTKSDPYLSLNVDISTVDKSHRVGGEHQTWGAEILIADYNKATNFGGLKAIPLLGGDLANVQPWRNAFAHLHQAIGYKTLQNNFSSLLPIQRFQKKPIDTLLYMQNHAFNAPLTSSCGRLFDAVAYLIGAFEEEEISYEGQVAMMLESLVTNQSFSDVSPYTFEILDTGGRLQIDPAPMFVEMLNDLIMNVPKGMISQRFHSGLAASFAHVVSILSTVHNIDTAALSGGVFVNKRLIQELACKLEEQGLTVLTHSALPSNNGGLSYGQALIAASRELARRSS